MVVYLITTSNEGIFLFEVADINQISIEQEYIQKFVTDYNSFSQICKLQSFYAFSDEQQAINIISDIQNGILNQFYKNFIENNIPTSKENEKIQIGVIDPKFGEIINEQLKYEILSNSTISNLIQIIQSHLSNFLESKRNKNNNNNQLESFQNNSTPINSILESLDKQIENQFIRIKELQGWNFPELNKVIRDNDLYIKVAHFIGDKDNATQDKLDEIKKIVNNNGILAQQIIDSASFSMGVSITTQDTENIQNLCKQYLELKELKTQIQGNGIENKNQFESVAIFSKNNTFSPFSQTQSLPYSTIQILGAEKALFKALKSKGKSPKYGLLYHNTLIGKDQSKNKGKISRYLQAKKYPNHFVKDQDNEIKQISEDLMKVNVQKELQKADGQEIEKEEEEQNSSEEREEMKIIEE